MMAFLAGVFVVAALLAIGSWLMPPTPVVPRSRWESFALHYMVGCAAVVVAGSAVLAIGLGFAAVAWTTLAVGLVAILQHLRRGVQIPLTADCQEETAVGFQPAWAGLLGALGLGSVLASLALPINEFDPLLHFAYKGKILAEVGSPLDEAMVGLVDEQGAPRAFGRIVTHPNYPLGVPILEALVSVFGRGWHERWIQLPLAFWALCLPALVHFGLRPIGRRAARAGAVVTAVTPILYERDFLEEGWADFAEAGLGNDVTLGAGADLPVAAMIAASCALFLQGRHRRSAALQLLAGLCLAGAVMMKNEGLALFGCVVLALLLSGALVPVGRERSRALGSVAGVGLGVAAMLPWLNLRGRLPAIDENYTEHFTLERIRYFLSGGGELVEKQPKALVGGVPQEVLDNPPPRMDELPGYFWSEFTDLRSWGLLWLLLLIALPWRLREWRSSDRRWLAMLCVGAVTLYFLILLVTPWYLPLLREKGIPERLLLHLVGPIAMLIGWRLGGDPETPADAARSEEVPARG